MGLFGSLGKMLNVDELISNLTGYVEARLALAKIEIRDEISQAIAKLIYFAIVAFIGALAIIFLSISISILLNLLFKSTFLGYLIVAFLYMITFALLARFKEHPAVTRRLNAIFARFFSTSKQSKADEHQ